MIAPGKLLIKLLRVKRQRLSPEGLSLAELKKVTLTEIANGNNQLLMSLHSPSVISGVTPYVSNKKEEAQFWNTTLDFIAWFKQHLNSKFVLVKEIDSD
jgi:hypothetical protein